MTPHDELRLLPWSGPDGKPCFLSTDDPAGRLSRLADEMEVHQLDSASALVAQGLKISATARQSDRHSKAWRRP